MKDDKDTQKSKRLSRDQWLSQALDVLASQGAGKLNIENLSSALGVSRGSFYWHFKDRHDFIISLLDFWHERYTEPVPEMMETAGFRGKEKLAHFLDTIISEDLTRFDLPIRSWAMQDAEVAQLLLRTDQFRLDYTRQIFSELGFEDIKADTRARACIAMLTMMGHMPQSEQTLRLELDAADAHARMLKWTLEPQPITATAWHDGALWVRLSGAEAAVSQAGAAIGGELQPDNGFWAMLKDHGMPLFRSGPIACRHLPPASPLDQEDQLLEWNGARRWTAAEVTVGGYQPYSDGYARFRCRDGGGDPCVHGAQLV